MHSVCFRLKAAVLEDLEGMIKQYKAFGLFTHFSQSSSVPGSIIPREWSSMIEFRPGQYMKLLRLSKVFADVSRNLFDMDRFIYAGWMIDVS